MRKQALRIHNKFLELSGDAEPAVSESGKVRMYYNTSTNLLMVSINGAAYEAVSSGLLLATVVANVANANVIGGLPILFRIDVADATADTDVVMTHKVRVIDAWAVNTGIGAHATDDTWQVKNGANAISDAVAKGATVNAIKRAGTINPANHEIAAAGTLRVSAVKATNAAVTLYVLAMRVA